MSIEAINIMSTMPMESIITEQKAIFVDSNSMLTDPNRLFTDQNTNNNPVNFIDFMQREMTVTNEKIAVAEQSVQQLAMGEAENLHQVMMSIEKAKTSFEMVVQVRNKLLEGYQEIMRMQV